MREDCVFNCEVRERFIDVVCSKEYEWFILLNYVEKITDQFYDILVIPFWFLLIQELIGIDVKGKMPRQCDAILRC